jgi:tetratricopeptide (TPR) repeat protein
MSGELLPFPLRNRSISPEVGFTSAELALEVPVAERVERCEELRLRDPEVLLSVCEVLRTRLESAPLAVHDDAEFFFDFLTACEQMVGHFDEHEYFLGELALIAGTACRVLFRKDETRRWFSRAEAKFVLTENGTANIARLAYQKLALAIEERRFEEVLEAAPVWAVTFRKLKMPESALKCLFLEGNVYRETGQTSKAIEVFSRICIEAESTRNVRLLALATGTLAQFHRLEGNLDDALLFAQKALPLLKQLDNRVNLAKLRWCVGDIVREQGNVAGALESYRSALMESEEIGLRGDVAAIHLVIADLLLDAGLDRQAEWEVRAALPIIDAEEMVPQGFAALGLLRESLRRRQIDRGALRELHGYFPQG